MISEEGIAQSACEPFSTMANHVDIGSDPLGYLHTAQVLAIRLVEALQIIGDTEEATNVLARALRNGATSGAIQTFIDSGPRVRALLIAMHHNAEHAHREFLPFLNTIVRCLTRYTSLQQALAMPIPETPLSPRERSVLRLICRGLSNKRIARELQIAPETVKSHAKHILVKLRAQTRAEAVARAAGLDSFSTLLNE